LPAILLYDLLAAGYGLVARQPAMAAGRLAGLLELPTLLRERHDIQSRRTAPIAEIERWLEPAEPPWQALREQKRLDEMLSERAPGEQ
jgi:hypothetical protein